MCGRACWAIAWARRMMAARSRAAGMSCGALFAGRDNADGLVLTAEAVRRLLAQALKKKR